MTSTNSSSAILKEIDLKYDAINQKSETHLEGLLWSKPITYWDYIQTDDSVVDLLLFWHKRHQILST